MENEEFKDKGNDNITEEVIKKDVPYITKGQKVTDFLIGFFGGILYSIAMTFTLGIFTQPPIVDYVGVFLAAVFLVYVGLIVYFIGFNKRKYIGIGLLGFVILILVMFGGCFFIANSMLVRPNVTP